jgi:hypothetical protein
LPPTRTPLRRIGSARQSGQGLDGVQARAHDAA